MDLNNLVYRIFDRSSDLYKDGWIRSLVECSPVDFKGNALPWLPYSAINLLQERLKEEMIVFEYGSGNSTLWLSKMFHRCILWSMIWNGLIKYAI